MYSSRKKFNLQSISQISINMFGYNKTNILTVFFKQFLQNYDDQFNRTTSE